MLTQFGRSRLVCFAPALATQQRRIWYRREEVTILFADVKGFTKVRMGNLKGGEGGDSSESGGGGSSAQRLFLLWCVRAIGLILAPFATSSLSHPPSALPLLTQMSERVGPERLVGLLDDLFRRFDHLAVQHQLEKIKTVRVRAWRCVAVVVVLLRRLSWRCQSAIHFTWSHFRFATTLFPVVRSATVTCAPPTCR